MLIIDTPTAFPAMLSNRVRHILALRADLFDLATFIVIDAGDRKDDIEFAAGFPIDPDYPPWEYVLDHRGVYEAPIITSDSGACTVLVVPDEQGVDPELLSLLRGQAEPATSSES